MKARQLYKKGWRHETLMCPRCGGISIYSKLNPDNKYSQFICLLCDFSDNLKEKEH